jgi:hypothetical protein
MEEEAQASGQRTTATHFMGRTIAEWIARHTEINSILRLGNLYPRQSVDVFFQAAMDSAGEDLSGITLRNVGKKLLCSY